MASYLSSYFTSNNSSVSTQQQQQQQRRLQPATSTWTTTLSSRLTSLRKALTKDSEEDDPDYEDCSHVSNVLRAYYEQKGVDRPDWLPANPKNPVAPRQPDYGMYGNNYAREYGSRHGNQPVDPYGPAPGQGRGTSGGRVGGLNDIWDPSPAQVPPPQSQSLRTPRPSAPHQPSFENQSSHRVQAASAPALSQSLRPPSGARPLPSQRAGSYQNTAAAGFTSKSDRLRAKLQGGGSGRSSPGPLPSPGPYGDSDPYGGQQAGGGNAYNPSASEPRFDTRASGGRDPGADYNTRGYNVSQYRSR